MSFRLLRCLAKAAAKHGGKYLWKKLDWAEAVYEMGVDAWEDYRRDAGEDVLRAEVQALAQAPADRVRQEVEAAVQAEAAGQPPEAQQALTAYLGQVPAAIRRSLRRPEDPTGTTVPATFSFSRPEDLLRFLPRRPPRFKPGDRPTGIGDWVLVEMVGVGGFGEVWKARHAHLRSKPPVALKFCLDQSAVPALRNEAGVLDRVMQHGRHPGIVPLLNTYLSADPPCLEYEFVEGGDLAGLIQELHALRRMTADTASRLVLRLSEIVGHTHQADPPIVHGDMKPANVLVRRAPDGKVVLRVTDFGIGGLATTLAVKEARQPTRSRQELLTVAVRGAYTPLYAAPEQMRRRADEKADQRDDVHALGVIWLQILTGDLGMLSVPTDWREQVEERGLGGELVSLLSSCIAPKAEKRPANAIILADQLKAALARADLTPQRKGTQRQGEPASPLAACPAEKGQDAARQDSPTPPATPRKEENLQRQPEPDLVEQVEGAMRAVERAHAEARRLAGQEHDYASAVQALEGVPEHLREVALYATLVAKRGEVARLDAEVRQAVRETRLTGLRTKVAALLALQPQREDLRRLLERLPNTRGRPSGLWKVAVPLLVVFLLMTLALVAYFPGRGTLTTGNKLAKPSAPQSPPYLPKDDKEEAAKKKWDKERADKDAKDKAAKDKEEADKAAKDKAEADKADKDKK